MMENVGPVGVRRLREALGSAAAVFEADRGALLAVRGIGRAVCEAILAQRERVDWQGELERAEAAGARLVAAVDAEYPRPLREIHDPPLALYVRGALQAGDRRAVAVVGTRRPSHYGRRVAEELAEGLARNGLTVVSGLAAGIDTAAHRGALAARGRTLGVMGSGLDCMYPAENRGLADEMAARGAVLSEFPFGRAPDKTTFPMRNRIVSGLALGVVVVEAGAKSGALITADQAASQGRAVLAVPGRIDAPGSAGTHALLRDGARLVTGVDDILEELECLVPAPREARPAGRAAAAAVTETEQQLLTLLQPGEQDVDTLIRSSGLAPAAMHGLLLGLEMKNRIRMLPGRIVERVE
ncbi:MAG: DNA-processing protein DprA [Lentisphaerae bacterium]|nr:DNA-processing protein DprA [Lentisphaerota bacterium]